MCSPDSSCCVRRYCVLAAESPEDSGVNQKLAERRGDESPENHSGDGIQNLAARFLTAEN